MNSTHTSNGSTKEEYLVEILIADLVITVCVTLTDHLINLVVGQLFSYRYRDPGKQGPTEQKENLPSLVTTYLTSAAVM